MTRCWWWSSENWPVVADPIESTVDQLYRWVWRVWCHERFATPHPGDPPDHILRAGAELEGATTHQRWVAGWIDGATHVETCDCHPARIARWRHGLDAQAVDTHVDKR